MNPQQSIARHRNTASSAKAHGRCLPDVQSNIAPSWGGATSDAVVQEVVKLQLRRFRELAAHSQPLTNLRLNAYAEPFSALNRGDEESRVGFYESVEGAARLIGSQRLRDRNIELVQPDLAGSESSEYDWR